jgi:hypothetical protein
MAVYNMTTQALRTQQPTRTGELTGSDTEGSLLQQTIPPIQQGDLDQQFHSGALTDHRGMTKGQSVEEKLKEFIIALIWEILHESQARRKHHLDHPSQELQRDSNVAYQMDSPPGSQSYPILHVFKKKLDDRLEPQLQLPALTPKRTHQWKGTTELEATWKDLELRFSFPDLVDKVL